MRFVFFVMVGVRYHLDLREMEGMLLGLFLKRTKGERGSLGVVRCGAAKGLLSLIVLTRHGATCGEAATASQFFFIFIFIFLYDGGFSFRFLTCVSLSLS